MKTGAVVVGAGVAGLMCGAMLRDAGLRVTVCEARDQVGGRVRTFRPLDGGPPLELGAQVVHGDRNPLWPVLGDTERRTSARDAEARAVLGGRNLHIGALARGRNPPWTMENRLTSGATADVPVATWLSMAGLVGTEFRVASEWFRQNWAAEPEELSAAGVAAIRRADCVGSGEYNVPAGFDSLTARLAAGLDVRTSCPVKELSWSPGRVEADAVGFSVVANVAVVTVPPTVVAEEVLRVRDLPVRKRAAAAQLGLGDACCVVATMSRPAPESAVVFDADGAGGFIRGFAGRSEVLAVAKARSAASMRSMAGQGGEAGPLPALLARALPWTAGARIARLDIADWGSDPWSGGAFTFPRVGALWAPAAWAEPVGDTVFFAGEATCGSHHPASVHGALESGIRAAAQIVKALGR